jgi:hypothetical protein
MKRTTFITVILFAGLFSINIAAQIKSKASSQPTTQTQAASEFDKKIGQVDTTIGKAKATVTKTKEAVKDFIGLFGSKTPNEGAVVIPAIEFDNENLESLVKAIKDRKEVKKATLEYTDGTATIKITLKTKAQADFWSELPKELKDVFKMRSKQENNILVEYKASAANKEQLAQN